MIYGRFGTVPGQAHTLTSGYSHGVLKRPRPGSTPGATPGDGFHAAPFTPVADGPPRFNSAACQIGGTQYE
jgi:hypothetical protein